MSLFLQEYSSGLLCNILSFPLLSCFPVLQSFLLLLLVLFSVKGRHHFHPAGKTNNPTIEVHQDGGGNKSLGQQESNKINIYCYSKGPVLVFVLHQDPLFSFILNKDNKTSQFRFFLFCLRVMELFCHYI